MQGGSLTLGASAIATGSLNFSAIGSGTFTRGTSTITISGSTNPFLGGSQTFYNLSFTASADYNIQDLGSCRDLSLVNTTGYITVTINNSFTATNLVTITGNNNAGRRILLASNTIGTARTITAAAATLTNVDFRDITGAGAASWSGTSIGDCAGNSNITFTTPVNRYYIAPVTATQNVFNANWATSSGGAAGSNFPLPQDTAIFDANSFGATGKIVQIANTTTRMGSMDWTGCTNSPTFNSNATWQSYGSNIFNSGMSTTGTGAMTFLGRGSSTFTCGGITLTFSVTFSGIGSTITLGNDFVSNSTFSSTFGTFTAANYNLTATTFSFSGSETRTLNKGSGTWTATGTGIAWNFTATNIAINDSGTIKFTNNSATGKTFTGGNSNIYNNFWNATSGSGVVTMVTTNTFNDIKIDPGRTHQFPGNGTITFNTLTASGTSGNLVTIASSFAANHNLVKATPGVLSLDYMNISRSQASPLYTFFAGNNSVDSGNNSGWLFTAPPVVTFKTIDGLPATSIKTINGVSIAAVKKFNGF